jgi:chorismate synthase
MSFNTFGRVFRFTTWGESHGPALGAVIDGCPPGLSLSEADIQPFLDARRPGTSRFTTQRQEPDAVRILSGVFEGRTTGTPISLMIENVDQRSKDYSEVAKAYRPGHADYAYDAKYGFRDYRGGGRSSARETAARVAAGGVARLVIPEVSLTAYVCELGGDAIDPARFDAAEIARNPVLLPRSRGGEALGGKGRCRAQIGQFARRGGRMRRHRRPRRLGRAALCQARQRASRGDACRSTRSRASRSATALALRGSAARPMPTRCAPGPMARPEFLANHAGGIAGGISTGQPVVVRVAFKPTSSILTPVETITREGEASEIVTKGRHDPCVGIRGTPVVEAMVALVLADQKLLHRAQCG